MPEDRRARAAALSSWLGRARPASQALQVSGPPGISPVHAPPPPQDAQDFLSVYFFSVSFCPCLPGPLGLDKLLPTPPPCPLTA